MRSAVPGTSVRGADTALPDKLMALASRHWPRANGGRTSRRDATRHSRSRAGSAQSQETSSPTPAAHRRTATAARHVNSMRRLVSRVRQNPKKKCVLIAKSSSLSTFDLASACLGAVPNGPAAVRWTVRACQERDAVTGCALTGNNQADVGYCPLPETSPSGKLTARSPTTLALSQTERPQ